MTEKSAIADFGRGIFQGAVEDPFQAVRQLAGGKPHLPAEAKPSLPNTLGRALGIGVDTALLSTLLRRPVGTALKAIGIRETGLIGAMTSAGLSGGLYGGLLTPSEPGTRLLTDRLKDAGRLGGSFALFTGAFGAAGDLLKPRSAEVVHPAGFSREAAGTLPEGAVRFANGDVISPLGHDDSLMESLDGSKTYIARSGNWLWTHPDGTVIKGDVIEPEETIDPLTGETVPPGVEPPKFKVSTMLADQTTIDGFPRGRQYLQEPPSLLKFDRAEHAYATDDGMIAQRTAAGDLSVRSPMSGYERVEFANGLGTAEHFGPGGAMFHGADGSEFVDLGDGSWYWTHPDNIKVTGTSDGAIQTTRADGTVEQGFPPESKYIKQPYSREVYDNHRVTRFPNGMNMNEAGAEPIIQQPDGTWTHTDHTGSHTMFPEGGGISRLNNGDTLYRFPDGATVTVHPDGSSIEHAGNSDIIRSGQLVTTKFEGGGQLTEDTNTGNTTYRFPDGAQVVLDENLSAIDREHP